MRALAVPVVASAAVAAASWALRARVPGGAERWDRTNHRGETLSLLEGPAWAAGALAGVALAPSLPSSARAGAALAAGGAAVFGAVDDLAERGSAKGLAGHIGELVRGRVTTGSVKVLGIGVTGVASAALLLAGGRSSGSVSGPVASAVDVVVAGGVVAGSANLANLLDLRPGRVLKAVALVAPALVGSPSAGSLVTAGIGASVALARPDLGEKAMLGDCGANAAGALLGAAAVASTASSGTAGRRARAVALAGLVALTLASEKVSFTRVIESTPGLRELDALGRRPAGTRG